MSVLTLCAAVALRAAATEVAKPGPKMNCTALCAGGPVPLNTSIPNVLLVSDSIGANGSGYHTNVIAMLEPDASTVTGGGPVGNAMVQHSGGGWTGIKGYCGTSFGVAACGPQWLGQSKWDGN